MMSRNLLKSFILTII